MDGGGWLSLASTLLGAAAGFAGTYFALAKTLRHDRALVRQERQYAACSAMIAAFWRLGEAAHGVSLGRPFEATGYRQEYDRLVEADVSWTQSLPYDLRHIVEGACDQVLGKRRLSSVATEADKALAADVAVICRRARTALDERRAQLLPQ